MPAAFDALAIHFAHLPDPRRAHLRRHALLDILAIALVASLCGADSLADIARFGRARRSWLKEHLGLSLEGGIPSHDTFGRVFAHLDAQALSVCLTAWTKSLAEAAAGQVVAIDGKTLRHSFDTATGQSALHLVSAWASGNSLVLAQQKVDDKSNEITAIPALLKLLDIKGCIVTCDAMGCQKEIAKQIHKQKAKYVLSLKKNHETLYEQVQGFFAWAEQGNFENVECGYYQASSYGHGRQEVRRCWCLDAAKDWPEVQKLWSGLQSVCLVEATRQVAGKAAPTVERRFFLSSLPSSRPRSILRAVRRHWHIENRLHWVLDVAFAEDACRIRKDNAPQNMALLRQLALNLLRQETTEKAGVKAKRLRAAWDSDYLLQVLAGPEATE